MEHQSSVEEAMFGDESLEEEENSGSNLWQIRHYRSSRKPPSSCGAGDRQTAKYFGSGQESRFDEEAQASCSQNEGKLCVTDPFDRQLNEWTCFAGKNRN